jgi:hypothetical protein
MDVRKYLDTHGIAWIPINIWENDGKKTPSVPKGEDQDWIHFRKEYTAAELKKIQKHFDSCNAIAIDTRKIHQMDIDEMSPEVVALQKDVPYFPSFSKGYPHFFSTSVKKQTKNCTAIPNCGDFLSGQWSYCRKDAVVHNAEKEFLVFDPTPEAAKSLTPEVAKIDAKDPKDIQKLIQKYVPNHAKTQVKSIKDNGSILTNGHYCFNAGRAHKSNHVYFKFIDNKLYQKCCDPECCDFTSEPFEITETVETEYEQITNDDTALQILITKNPNYVKRLGQYRMVYDDTTGMWESDDIGSFMRLCIKTWKGIDEPYGNMVRKMETLWKLSLTLPNDEKFFKEAELRTKGKVLFEDCVSDKLNNCILEFSSNYYFVHKIPHPFPKTKPANVDIVDKFYFTQPFPEPGVADWLRHDKMLDMYGLGSDTFIIEIGTGANGKSRRADGMKRALGGYAGDMSGDHFAVSVNTNAAGANPQLMPLKTLRLAYISEPRKGIIIDMSIIKKITGGDPISCRALHKGVETFISRTKEHFLTNGMLKMSECEAGSMDRRLRILESNTRYLKNIEQDNPEEQEYKADDNLAKLVIESSDALLWILVNEPFRSDILVPESVVASSRETIEDQDDTKKLFFSNFEKDVNGKVYSRDIKELLNIPFKLLSSKMKDWGFGGPKIIRIGAETGSGYTGISKKSYADI